MTRARLRGKTVRKLKRKTKNNNLLGYEDVPHTFVFSKHGVGLNVKKLGKDVRQIFEPFTSRKIKATKKNNLKDFISIAGPLNVSHIMYFSHTKPKEDKASEDSTLKNSDESTNGSVNLHLVKSPHGPSLTFKVLDYCHLSDVANMIRRVFSPLQYSSPPLLVMTGFNDSIDGIVAPHLRLVVDMFQNMLPPLNIQKIKLNEVKRVLLLSRDVDLATSDDYVYVRHYHIKTENRQLSKPFRRLGLGGSKLKKKSKAMKENSVMNPGLGACGYGKSTGVPNLARFKSMEDFINKANLLTDSGLSELDEEQKEVELPMNLKGKGLRDEAAGTLNGLPHIASNKATIKLIEIGPRLCLQLLKIEEGLNKGDVLYHKYHKKTPEEIVQQKQAIEKAAKLKKERREYAENRRRENERLKEEKKLKHKEECLAGMKRENDETDVVETKKSKQK